MPEYKEGTSEKVSASLMNFILGIASSANPIRELFSKHNIYKKGPRYESGYGTTLDLFLLPRKTQEQIYLKRGYKKGALKDYGLVKAAVGDHDYPVYQINKDEATRDQLVFATNDMDSLKEGWVNIRPSQDKLLYNANSYPEAFYINGITGEPFYKAWDLLNYGLDANGAHGSTTVGQKHYGKTVTKLANLLDKIGSPTVITTGFIKGSNPATSDYRYSEEEYVADLNLMLDLIKKNYGNENSIYPSYVGRNRLELPELIVTPKKKIGGKLNYTKFFK